MTFELGKKIIKAYGSINDEIEYINAGGCGVFATALCKRLQALGFDAKIYALIDVLDDDDRINFYLSKHQSNLSALHKAMINGECPSEEKVYYNDHYCVGVDEYYFDSTGVCKMNDENEVLLDGGVEFMVIHEEVSMEELHYGSFIEETRMVWNSDYDRSQNDRVVEILERALSTLPS